MTRHTAAVLLLLPVTALAQVQVTPTPDAPVVTLSVQESTEVAPNLATVFAGVETEAQTAGAALATNSAKMTTVLAAIRAAGVADRDVRTSSIRINSRYDFAGNTRTFRGYQASNRVTVLLCDVRRIGAFLDRVTAAGVNDLNGPTFTVDDPERYRGSARDRAVIRAAAEAQAYARRADFATARLLSITEGGGTVRPYDGVVSGSRVDAPAVVETPPPVMGGQQSVGLSITAVYQLER